VTHFRRWQLTSAQPYSLQLAADARFSRTDYSDDQVWELHSGTGEAAALTLQTRYGGRAGLASLVPLWVHEGRTIYQSLTYTKPPLITAFAPAYIQAEAELLPGLTLLAEYWAMESHAVGARFTLSNATKQHINIRLDLFGHVGINNQEQKLGIIAMKDAGNALYMGQIGNLHPVVALDNGSAQTSGGSVSPKIGTNLIVPSGGSISTRWVHAGRLAMRDSLALALHWLKEDWDAYFDRIAQGASAIPSIETGDPDLDVTIAASYQQLVQSFLKPTSYLPYASFVGVRQSTRGFNGDADRAWNGQQVQLAYLTALAIAPIDPKLAEGILRNYVAVQSADGRIDSKPGLVGQREGLMAAPLLARLAWNLYQYTQDKTFLSDVFSPLFKFIERWFASDLDADSDGFPEWQHERQTGYVYVPTFAVNQAWSQGANIRTVESPDLLTYLLSDAYHLREMLIPLGKTKLLQMNSEQARINTRLTALQKHLQSLWRENRYVYRDRDTHETTTGAMLYENGQGDEEHLLAYQLTPPNRLIIKVIGGLTHSPQFKLTLMGLNAKGAPLTETADSKLFAWRTGYGTYTSQHIFSQIDRVRCDGLSRAYNISVQSMDTTRMDLNALMPLASRGLKKVRAKELVQLLKDEAHFWRPNGITMTSTQDAHYDPANANGSGGVWAFWVTLFGESLLEYGFYAEASEMLKRLLKVQVAVLKEQKNFFEFYHSDEPKGLGERGHIAGIVPLHLLLSVMGIQVQSSRNLWTGGKFAWGSAVTLTQFGVRVRRSKKGIHIEFPSGHKVDLPADAPWQEVVDPTPSEPVEPPAAIQEAELPTPVNDTAKPSAETPIKIEVEME
jgi:hypothetical protein